MVAGVEVPRGDGSTVVRVRAGSSLADFAERIGADPAALITVLFRMGEMATVNQSLDEDTFKLLGAELGYDVQILSPEDEDREILESFDIDLEAEQAEEDDADLVPRPPVVTVMGHVDHGKTKLLDAIRHARVIETEAGGITQHIGAYQIRLDYEGEHRAITFIDTPGHEAFTQMRARGADVTDIAVLVVAADDGVMPQTIEAVNHAQAAGVKIIVAVNKIDVDGANPDKVRAQLTEYGIVTEEYGGDTMFVDISAKERTGIDDLLEAILYTADADLDLRANPDHDARGVAIEAKLDQGRGAVVTALVQTGTLRIGDSLVVGTAYGRVRAMFDETGAAVEEAEPSRPVQILGMSSVPSAGDSFLVASDDRTARQIADKREAAKRAATLARRRKRISLENLNDALKQGTVQTLNLIIKGDASGSVEALEGSLLELEVGDEVALQIIHRGVGAITQNDVNLATVDNAIIIGFNVRPAERVAEMADREGVEMKFYSVIYKAIEDVEAALKGMLKPVFEEVQLGRAEIRQVFRSGKFGNIAGSIVRSGAIRRGAKARLVRDGVVVAPDLEIASLRREKDDVTEVREGYECGITLGYKDIHEGDVIGAGGARQGPRRRRGGGGPPRRPASAKGGHRAQSTIRQGGRADPRDRRLPRDEQAQGPPSGARDDHRRPGHRRSPARHRLLHRLRRRAQARIRRARARIRQGAAPLAGRRPAGPAPDTQPGVRPGRPARHGPVLGGRARDGAPPRRADRQVGGRRPACGRGRSVSQAARRRRAAWLSRPAAARPAGPCPGATSRGVSSPAPACSSSTRTRASPATTSSRPSGAWPGPARPATPERSTPWPPASCASAWDGPRSCSATSRAPTRSTRRPSAWAWRPPRRTPTGG